MLNIIREIFVEDQVQQVSTSIKETLRYLYLLRHVRDFKFYTSQAQWRVKIFTFFKKRFLLLRLCFIFFRFPSGTVYLEVFLFLHSHYGLTLHFYFYSFLRSLICLRISVKRNFYSHLIVHFSFYYIIYEAAQLLWIENAANVGRLNNWKAIFILWLNDRTLTVCNTPAFQLKFCAQTGFCGLSQVRKRSLVVEETPTHAW